jgi:transposase
MLTDEYWAKLRTVMLEMDIYDKPNHRQTMEGILYRLRAGCPWRDLPEAFGGWNAVYKSFNDWSQKKNWCLHSTNKCNR